MGTRHLIKIQDKENNTALALFCQWDGYLENAGIGILDFLRTKGQQDKLLAGLKHLKMCNDEEFNQAYTDLGLVEERIGYDDTVRFAEAYPGLSRETGYKILSVIADFKPTDKKKKLLTYDNSEFDTEFDCEFVYVIDFHNELFSAYTGEHSAPIFDLPLDALPMDLGNYL